MVTTGVTLLSGVLGSTPVYLSVYLSVRVLSAVTERLYHWPSCLLYCLIIRPTTTTSLCQQLQR